MEGENTEEQFVWPKFRRCKEQIIRTERSDCKTLKELLRKLTLILRPKWKLWAVETKTI